MAQVKAISQAEYARHRGVSEAAVSKAIAKQRISLGADGLIDPVAADAQWQRNTRVRAQSSRAHGRSALAAAPIALTASQNSELPSAVAGVSALEDAARVRDLAAQSAKPGDDDYWRSRGRRESAEAETAEIELAKLKGDVIDVLAIEKLWAQRMSQTREVLQQLRARLAPRLAAEMDVRKIDEMLMSEHDAALRAMAGRAEPSAAQEAAV